MSNQDLTMQFLFQEVSKHLILTSEIKDDLINFFKPGSYPKGSFLVECGKKNQFIFFIQHGLVRTYHVDKNGNDITSYFSCDNMFTSSYYSFLADIQADENIVAMEDTEVYQLSLQDLHLLYQKNAEWQKIGRILAEGYYLCSSERERVFQSLSAKEKYLHFIKNMPAKIVNNVPLKYVASYLGIHPGSLSRLRNESIHKC